MVAVPLSIPITAVWSIPLLSSSFSYLLNLTEGIQGYGDGDLDTIEYLEDFFLLPKSICLSLSLWLFYFHFLKYRVTLCSPGWPWKSLYNLG